MKPQACSMNLRTRHHLASFCLASLEIFAKIFDDLIWCVIIEESRAFLIHDTCDFISLHEFDLDGFAWSSFDHHLFVY